MPISAMIENSMLNRVSANKTPTPALRGHPPRSRHRPLVGAFYMRINRPPSTASSMPVM